MTEYEKNIQSEDIFQFAGNSTEMLFNETEEELILRYLNSHNEVELLRQMNAMLDQRFLFLEHGEEFLRPVLNQFVCILDKFLLGQGLSLRSIAHNSQSLFIYLMRIETLEETKSVIQCLIKRIFHCLEENRKVKYTALVEKVKEYIQANYSRDITLESVSHCVYLSKFHLSRVFKRETGQTLNDYLMHIRITMAKKLLVETELTVKEVALKVGYVNDRSLSKAFKNAAGMTPGQFRVRSKEKRD